MADIQFDINLDLVEKYVPAENVTVVQEDFQSVKFLFTITNREKPVDLTGATDIVVSFIKPDGHLVLQNDATLVNGKVELVANPQAFTYVGKTYFQVQYKIGSSIYNTRQAFLWVEKGHTSCQTVSSTDFAPMLDQAIQAGQMLAGIELQALIDSKVTAENAQKDVDNLAIRVGALEVTIVGLSSKVSTLEAKDVEQDNRILALENSYPNLDPINQEITNLKAKDTVQDSRISTLETDNTANKNKIAYLDGQVDIVNDNIQDLVASDANQSTKISAIENKNTAQDEQIAANSAAIVTNKADADSKITGLTTRVGTAETDIAGLKTKNTQQDTRMTAIENKDAQQDGRLDVIEGVNTTQNNRLANVESKNTEQDGRLTAVEGINTTQNTRLTDVENKNTSQDTAIAGKVSKSGDTVTGNIDVDISIGAASKGYRWRDATGALFGLETSTTGELILYDYKAAARVWQYDPVAKRLSVLSDTNLLKTTGGTMTGNLTIDSATSGGFRLHQAGTPVMGLFVKNNTGDIRSTYMYDYQANKISVEHRPDTGFTFSDPVTINGATNVVKKTGDTMTGPLDLDNNIFMRLKGETGKRDWLVFRDTAHESVVFAPRLADNSDWDWSKQIEFRPDNFIVNGQTNLMKKTDYTAKDGRADLVLTADATNFDTSRPPVAVRRGNTVTIRGAIGVSASATANLVTTLPTDMRPIDSLTQTILTNDGSATTLEVYPDGRVILSNSAKGKNIYIVFTYVVN